MPLQDRLAAVFNRRKGTRWTPKEEKALQAASPINEGDLSLVERYYQSERGKDGSICRRDLPTLLNNFPGEVDRARRWEDAKASSGLTNRRRNLAL
ncbi:MAG: hypothetical protein ABJB49_10580 [Nitrospirota bacterium]